MTENAYDESERKIFEYSAGPTVGPRAVDPLDVLRQFVIAFQGRSLREVVREEWAVPEPEAREGMSEEERQRFKQDSAWVRLQSAKAEQLLVDTSRKIFEMEDFDKSAGKGATDREVLNVITEFLNFLS